VLNLCNIGARGTTPRAPIAYCHSVKLDSVNIVIARSAKQTVAISPPFAKRDGFAEFILNNVKGSQRHQHLISHEPL